VSRTIFLHHICRLPHWNQVLALRVVGVLMMGRNLLMTIVQPVDFRRGARSLMVMMLSWSALRHPSIGWKAVMSQVLQMTLLLHSRNHRYYVVSESSLHQSLMWDLSLASHSLTQRYHHLTRPFLALHFLRKAPNVSSSYLVLDWFPTGHARKPYRSLGIPIHACTLVIG